MRCVGTKYFSMPKRPAKFLSSLGFLLLIVPGIARGQMDVIEWLRGLEQRHEVKFSFVDEDLQGMEVDLRFRRQLVVRASEGRVAMREES